MYKTKEEGEMVIMRFFYKEHEMENLKKGDRPQFPPFFGPAVIMPKAVFKDIMKKFLGFIAVHDEHRKEEKK